MDAAIDRADSSAAVKAENGTEVMFLNEIGYLQELMTAASILMKEPLKALEKTIGTAYEFAKTIKEEHVA